MVAAPCLRLIQAARWKGQAPHPTIAVVNAAKASGGRVLAISDSLVSPVAKPAEHVLQIREAEVRKFRSLSASMCLAQALVINFAFEATRADGKAREDGPA